MPFNSSERLPDGAGERRLLDGADLMVSRASKVEE
jgi:hypothetical protein